MVQGNDMVLYIDSGAAFFGRSYQYPDFTFPHQIKQSLPFFLCFCIMDKRDLLFWDSILYQSFFDIGINAEPAPIIRGSDIRKDKLSPDLSFCQSCIILLFDTYDALLQLSIRIFWCFRIQKSGICAKQPCICCQFQKIIH